MRAARALVVPLAMWALAACWSPSSVAPPANPEARPDVTALVRRADEAFAAMQKPDYRRPFVREPDVPRQVSDLYLEACRTGDKRSCWLADAISHSERTIAALHHNCLRGDVMSCRALPRETDVDAKPDKQLRGWAGRAVSCEAPECQEVLTQECAAGFPESCWALEMRERDELFERDEGAADDEDRPLHVRADMLARQGCRAGIVGECRWVDDEGLDYDEQSFARVQRCILAREKCRSFLSHRSDPIKSRDLLEYGCQYGDGSEQDLACRAIDLGYQELGFPEPIPGRARAIGTWNCQRFYRGDPRCVQDPWFFFVKKTPAP